MEYGSWEAYVVGIGAAVGILGTAFALGHWIRGQWVRAVPMILALILALTYGGASAVTYSRVWRWRKIVTESAKEKMQKLEAAQQKRKEMMDGVLADTDTGIWLIDLLPILAVIGGVYLFYRALIHEGTAETESPPRENGTD